MLVHLLPFHKAGIQINEEEMYEVVYETAQEDDATSIILKHFKNITIMNYKILLN